MHTRHSLWFSGPRCIELRTEEVMPPAPGMAMVRVRHSAISPGSEMLVYRNEMPALAAADANIPALAGALQYPLKYGYTCVGEVVELGSKVDAAWLNRRVFGFNPHESAFCDASENLIALPDDMTFENALLLPAAETAVNFLHDGAPLLGERVAVLGAGLLGQITLAALASFPINELSVFEPEPARQKAAQRMGASAAHSVPLPEHTGAFDLVYELSGAPAALNSAMELCAYSGRVIVGSWYGKRRAALDLGGRFHRNRIQLISSQVSSIAPALQGRWNKARRFEAAWSLISRLPAGAIARTHVLSSAAKTAYDCIDAGAGTTTQFVLDWA